MAASAEPPVDVYKRQVLPNGTGKTRKVLVFAKDAKLDEAKEAGADFAGGMELVEKIQKENWFDFDVVVATPDLSLIHISPRPLRKTPPYPPAGRARGAAARAPSRRPHRKIH